MRRLCDEGRERSAVYNIEALLASTTRNSPGSNEESAGDQACSSGLGYMSTASFETRNVEGPTSGWVSCYYSGRRICERVPILTRLTELERSILPVPADSITAAPSSRSLGEGAGRVHWEGARYILNFSHAICSFLPSAGKKG